MTVDLNLGLTRKLIARSAAQGLLRNELAYVLATALWESAGTVEPVREAYYLGEPAAEEYRKGLAYYPFYGRGLVQLTWEENYQLADDELGLGGELVADPDLALGDKIAIEVIISGMAAGWFTGLCLSDFIDLEHSDFVGARAIVNGSDHASDIAELAEEYDAALLAIGYGVDRQPAPDWPRPPSDALRAVIRNMADRAAAQDARLAALEEWAGSFAGAGT